MSLATNLFKNSAFLRGKYDMLKAIKKAKASIRSVKKSKSSLLKKIASDFSDLRGRPLFYPAIYSGLGNGSLVELMDGSVKYDFITGIGTHFFGHSDLDLLDTAIQAGSQNVVMHGNLQTGLETKDFLETLLKMAGPPLEYGWLSASGSFANDNALKIIRQKKTPAYKIIAFKDCFHGRSVAMAELTDHEGYRKGLHYYGDVVYIPFFDAADPDSIHKSVRALKTLLDNQNDIAGFIFELIQGEGGFKPAPREFFVALMDVCRHADIAIWIDEVQTVGRTGELFAFQKLKLQKYVDVVTVGKMLQNCATLYRESFNPKPGLLAGTFCGSSTSLAVGKRILDRLKKEGFFGRNGKIMKLEKWAVKGLKELQKNVGSGLVSNISAFGAMIAWQYNDGSLEKTKEFVLKAFEEGVMLFSCGRGPYKVRFLLPAAVIKEADYLKALKIIERVIKKLN